MRSSANRSELAQAGPIVGDENRIARIRGVVLHAGGLARDQPFETDLPFETGNILRGVIGDSGNRVTVGDQVSGPQINNGTRSGTEEFSLSLARLGRMLGQFDDLPFRDTPDLIQVQAPPAFGVLGLFPWAKKGISDHQDRREGGPAHGENNFPVLEQGSQLAISNDRNEFWSNGQARGGTAKLTSSRIKPSSVNRPTVVYLTETEAGQ
jgi:hypothetical protein